MALIEIKVLAMPVTQGSSPAKTVGISAHDCVHMPFAPVQTLRGINQLPCSSSTLKPVNEVSKLFIVEDITGKSTELFGSHCDVKGVSGLIKVDFRITCLRHRTESDHRDVRPKAAPDHTWCGNNSTSAGARFSFLVCDSEPWAGNASHPQPFSPYSLPNGCEIDEADLSSLPISWLVYGLSAQDQGYYPFSSVLFFVQPTSGDESRLNTWVFFRWMAMPSSLYERVLPVFPVQCQENGC